MAYNPNEFLMISGIQHFLFCKRQWALIHIEQQWQDNILTIEGQALHHKADQPFIREKRKNKLIVRALPVQSHELGVTGICDVVEFVQHPQGVTISGSEGLYLPFPVEYKRGKHKLNNADLMQLLAQAVCLEEMLVCEITHGYIYYNETKTREKIIFTAQQREQLKQVVLEMQHYFARKHTPKVKTGNFCKKCSLQHICMPMLMSKRSVKSYIKGVIEG